MTRGTKVVMTSTSPVARARQVPTGGGSATGFLELAVPATTVVQPAHGASATVAMTVRSELGTTVSR